MREYVLDWVLLVMVVLAWLAVGGPGCAWILP